MAEGRDSTKQVVIPYPAGMPQMLKLSDEEFSEELRFLAAAKLYELGRLSSGKAARLAGMPRVKFLRELARVEAPAINLRDEECSAEIQAARDLGEWSSPEDEEAFRNL